jgi:hypothetical protein
MKKPNINKLKYPLWFNIVFSILTVAIPLIFIVVQGFNSPSTTFKISFTMICATLLLWIFVRKFVFNKYEEKLRNRKASLEHDYEIEVGNPQKAKWLWYSNEIILSIINAVQVLLIGGLILLMAVGIESAAIKVKGLSFLIAILYIIAYVIKFILLLKLRGDEVDSEVTDEQPKQ